MKPLGRTLRTLAYLRPAQVLWRLWYRARLPLFARTCRWKLESDAALPIRFASDPWPGEAENGRRLLAGRIRLLGAELEFGQFPDWHHPFQTPLWRFTLNYFEWLADLKCLGTPEAADRARELVEDWWDIHHDWFEPEGWHPYPLSLRLVAWLSHASWLLDGAPECFRRKFAAALDSQARHLPRVLERDVGGNHLIKNLKALIIAARCLPAHAHGLNSALGMLEREAARQILPDGGHYERSPAYHVQVLRDLLEVRAALEAPPLWLGAAIARMIAAYQALRHPDGGLALFNDGEVGEPAILAALDRLLAPLPAPPPSLPDSGYYRLTAGRITVLADAGRCCPDDLPAHAHADTLSFELSDGRARLIVNAGTFGYQVPEWRNRLRGTAAHSAPSIDAEDSAEVYGIFRLGRRPRRVLAERDGATLTASHDGYGHLGIPVTRRRLVLDEAGLSGVDEAEGSGLAGRRLMARFHLHPAVEAMADGDAIQLRLGESCWRFTCRPGTARLEAGVYAPHFGIMVETKVIVCAAEALKSSARLEWRLAPSP